MERKVFMIGGVLSYTVPLVLNSVRDFLKIERLLTRGHAPPKTFT